ncbi:MAG TPA: histidine kinase dimerization/phospho-acceptor domain-containing protein, partial [Nitrospirota bacterium]
MRLNLFSRFFLGYFILLVLAAGMSIYAIVQLGSVTDVTRSIMVDNQLVSLHKDLTDALLSETRYEKKYLIMQDGALYDGYLKSRGEFELSLHDARALDIPREAREALNKVAELHQVYSALFQDETGYLKEGLPYAKEWYAAEKEQAVNAAIDELLNIRLVGQQTIYNKVKKLSEAGMMARTIAEIASATLLLFGVLLAVWITRSITRPLTLIQKKTKDIAEGVFEADLKLPSTPEISDLAQAFNTMCSKLKEVDKMKSDFFSLMSHELRTPLTAIKEGTNLFLEGKGGEVTERQKKLLTIISEESERLIGLVNSVLDLSKLEAGMLTFNFTKTDLSPLITRAVNEVGPLAEAKHIRINREVPDLPPLSLDIERMLQVLRNLLGNALKFTPRGGTVSIIARSGEGKVLVAVADTGPGIPKEHAAVIFDKFRQVPGSAKLPGTGLG